MWAKLQRSWSDNQELPDDFLHPGNELLSLVHEIVARMGSLNVYVMNVDGSNKTRLTSDPARDGWPDWSPDASLIVFSSERDGEREIYTMRRNGSDQKRLTNSAAECKRLQTKYCNTDPILTVMDHLRDVVLRIISQIVGYDGTYQPPVIRWTIDSKFNWVRPDTR